MSYGHKLPKDVKDLKGAIDEYMTIAVEQGRVQSYEDVKNTLTHELGFEINREGIRKGVHRVSIKTQEHKLPISLTGFFYEPEFEVISGEGQEPVRAIQKPIRTSDRGIESLRKRVQAGIEERSGRNAKLLKWTAPTDQEIGIVGSRINSVDFSFDQLTVGEEVSEDLSGINNGFPRAGESDQNAASGLDRKSNRSRIGGKEQPNQRIEGNEPGVISENQGDGIRSIGFGSDSSCDVGRGDMGTSATFTTLSTEQNKRLGWLLYSITEKRKEVDVGIREKPTGSYGLNDRRYSSETSFTRVRNGIIRSIAKRFGECSQKIGELIRLFGANPIFQAEIAIPKASQISTESFWPNRSQRIRRNEFFKRQQSKRKRNGKQK
jgi:hypothetical protein